MHPEKPPQPQNPGPACDSVSASVSASAGASSRLTVPPASRIRRRNRMITSCLECRRRKLKCDKSHPCANCTKTTRSCIFLAPALDQASQLKIAEIKEKVGSLERLLERDVAASVVSSPNTQGSAPPDGADDGLSEREDDKDLVPSPLTEGDAVYDGEADDADADMLDLGIRIGKMRITERIGGYVRPTLPQEIEYSLTENAEDVSRNSANHKSSYPRPDYLRPGPNYIAPTSSFLFGNTVEKLSSSIIDFLPSKPAADRLIQQYFTAVHPVAQTVHRPSFEKEYEYFWDEVLLGIEPPVSVQTIVFAAMFSSIVSTDETTILRDFGTVKAGLVESFRLGTEAALGRANFLRTTKVQTLQGFVMYLIALCRDEVSRAHSVLVGTAIRMAECMGLHRDGEQYGLNPLETHVRRLIWYQICFLDIRTCEAQGPRPTIRSDDFDTKLPLNVNDVDFDLTRRAPSSVDRWAEMTFCLIKFEAIEMMRNIWVDRARLECRKTSLTAVLSKIETFRREMATKYDHLIDDKIPIQHCARLVKSLLLSRLYVMVLHRYHNGVSYRMPERLRDLVVESAIVAVESAISLDVEPDVQQWRWYIGSYNQYHAAFLLLTDVYFYPPCKQEERIWPFLDYVFEMDSSEPRRVRARKVFEDVQQKTAKYQQIRKIRTSSNIGNNLYRRFPLAAEEIYRLENAGRERKASSNDATSRELVSPPDVACAGISDSGVFWSLPDQGSSEGYSETWSVAEQQKQSSLYGIKADDIIADIDWEAFDQIFPPEQFGSEFAGPTLGVRMP